MNEPLVLGIDTSNYTTSVSVLALSGELLANEKMLLPVPENARGLRQSDALFSHTKQLPLLMQKVAPLLSQKTLAAVGYSARPRNRDDSYMPCFLAGEAAATSAAAASGAKLYSFSHQCGHIMAAVRSCGNEALLAEPFGAFHISGGTTELLKVVFNGESFAADIVGGTKDLNAGQVIDRIGVAMGLPFPCGPALDKIANSYEGKIPSRALSVSDCYVNLSGLENLAAKLWHDTQDKACTAPPPFAFARGQGPWRFPEWTLPRS